ncbi:MAG: hypothetical protein E7603_09380 [Ruminococcaceae bacterium]|nr:hypothetical protein [Oscillospiraceae bacterium]
MENKENFVIENGILMKYKGKEQHVVIPEGITEIAEEAFCYKSQIISVSFPQSLKKIGAYAFHGCYALQSLTIGKNVAFLGSNAFSQCSSLRFLKIEGKNVKISAEAFSCCWALEQCELACEPETAGKMAYLLRNCFEIDCLAYVLLKGIWKASPSLTERLTHLITLKSNRRMIFQTFLIKKDASLIHQYLSLFKTLPAEELDGWIKETQDPEIRVLLLGYKNKRYSPEYLEKQREIEEEKEWGVREKTISDYRKQFSIVKDYDCYIITSYKKPKKDEDSKTEKKEEEIIVIPGTIKGLPVKIADFAFARSSGADISGHVIIEEGCTQIGDFAFSDNKELKSIVIPSKTKIGSHAFFDCTWLTSVSIGENAVIGKSAFARCASLRETEFFCEIPCSENYFSGCHKLKDAEGFVIVNGILFDYLGFRSDITVPKHVRAIAPHALAHPNYMKTVKIPAHTQISEKAFISQTGTLNEVEIQRYS